MTGNQKFGLVVVCILLILGFGCCMAVTIGPALGIPTAIRAWREAFMEPAPETVVVIATPTPDMTAIVDEAKINATGAAKFELTPTGTPESTNTPSPESTPTPANTATPSNTPTPTSEQKPNECGQARDLGPWAPNADGSGETFEVTASQNDSVGVVLGLWWPGGVPEIEVNDQTMGGWGTKEVTTFIEPGLSVEVQAGAGRGFDYPLGCSAVEIDAQMEAHMEQRADDTSYHGFVEIEELIELGLVEVRFDRR